MIDNFAPQPYPLECSVDGDTWRLVVGWREVDGQLVPMSVILGDLALPAFDPGPLHYRVADTRPIAGRAAPAVASTGTPARRERSPHTE